LAGTPPVKYLANLVEGGKRGEKRSEMAMRYAGTLPAGKFIVPAKGYPLNKYGNIPAAKMNKILSNTRSRHDPIQNSAAGTQKFFVAKIGAAHGVFERMARRRIRLALAFVSQPEYKARHYDFLGAGQRYANAIFKREMDEAMSRALASANR